MNGQIEIELNGRKVTVMGGPYREKPEGIKGVKLAPEINAACDVSIDIPDYSVPGVLYVHHAMKDMFTILNQDGKIYLGCFGGIGRTGMIMACLIKTIGMANLQAEEKTWLYKIKKFFGGVPSNHLWMINYPIQFIRDEYLSTAVETPEQEAFVKAYDPTKWLKHFLY